MKKIKLLLVLLVSMLSIIIYGQNAQSESKKPEMEFKERASADQPSLVVVIKNVPEVGNYKLVVERGEGNISYSSREFQINEPYYYDKVDIYKVQIGETIQVKLLKDNQVFLSKQYTK